MKLEASKRWFGLGALVYRIESVGKEHYKLEKETIVNTLSGLESYEDDDFRIRLIKQSELCDNLAKEGKTAKWGIYLKAPKAYFDIFEELRNSFVRLKDVADIWFGIKTGKNEFFYLSAEKIAHWGIEEKFLAPVIKSPKELTKIVIDSSLTQNKLFVCRLSKQELRKRKMFGALRYIEHGEKQVTKEGTAWSEVPSVRGRKFWWSLDERKSQPDFTLVAFVNERFFFPINQDKVYVSDVFFEGAFKPDVDKELATAWLNSTINALSTETLGRTNLGEGVLKFIGPEINELVVLDERIIDTSLKTQIKDALKPLLSRPIQSIFQEVKMKDRQKLDRLVLKALGLDPKEYLKPIYDGLTELVRERIELAGMRKKVKQVKTQRDVDRLKKQVMEEVLPNGLKKFPDEFLEAPLKPQDYQNISIPNEPLKLGAFFLGTQEVISDSGFSYQAQTVEEAKYIIYSQKPDTFVVSLPKDKVVITKAVNDYERYLEKLRNELFQEFFRRTFDHKLSDTLAQTVFVELGIPGIATA
jgi:hypothetical protein